MNINENTRIVIGEILKNQSRDKDKILYDLLTYGDIIDEDETERNQEITPYRKTEESKPIINKVNVNCKQPSCKYYDNGKCTNELNGTTDEQTGYPIRCDQTSQYGLYEKK